MVTPEEKERIGKLQRKSKEELKEDVGILKEWWGKQAHLPALTPGKNASPIGATGSAQT